MPHQYEYPYELRTPLSSHTIRSSHQRKQQRSNIPVSTLARWRNEHRELPYAKIGRLIRYREQDINAWIEQQLVTPLR
ncbi:helix-turn-helix domain-containing protein [Bifidobacterium hapali]|uniref:helix-turn-helix domain-containing protein n=1 Tax=Bifidobacterium hapali TaxID=1630172 RepID=UPI001B80B9FD